MKSILLPTDFSNNSIIAIDFAVEKLGNEQTTYHLVHVYQIPQGGQSGLFYLLEEMQAQAKKDMEELIDKLKSKYPQIGDRFKSKVVQGDLADESNALANSLDADCIVMGTKGASGIAEVLIGSNTVKLINSLKRPMYAIPQEYANGSINEVLVAYDGSEMNEKLSKPIINFAKKLQLEVGFTHIRIKDEQPLQNWSDLKPLFSEVTISYNESHAEDFKAGLVKITEGKNALLVVIRHKQGFWESLFNLSDSRKALMHAKLPVLVIPE